MSRCWSRLLLFCLKGHIRQSICPSHQRMPLVRSIHRQLTWCRLFSQLTSGRKHNQSAEISPSEWTSPLQLEPVELDLDYLCNPDNVQEIQNNINNRKGVGDILLVRKLYECYQRETDPIKRQHLHRKFIDAALNIPNKSHPLAPIGDESNARLVETVGTQRKFDFEPLTVVEIGEKIGHLRTDKLTQTTGPKTYFFKDGFAKLEQALIRYTLSKLRKKGFQLVGVPELIHPDIVEGCGFKTTGETTQVYRLCPETYGQICLVGTAEMPLAGYFLNEVLDHKNLPVRVAAVSRCYRAETSGVEEEQGIYRVHQFTKVEMFGVTDGDPISGDNLLSEFLGIEKEIFSELGLHFRILDMPSVELGAPACRKFDTEAWMPAKKFWGEISSTSNCTDFQSRRLNIKYRNNQGNLRHCTTVNGTACAIPRTIMAIVENFQEKDGTVQLPKVLWEFMGGRSQLSKSDHHGKIHWIKFSRSK
ncbi:hypothetical protein ACJMK2_035901 [Sinanodonta woodiana]